MEETRVINQMVKGQLIKREYASQKLENYVRMCGTQHNFVSTIMGQSYIDIIIQIDEAVNPSWYAVYDKETGEGAEVYHWTAPLEELERKIANSYSVEMEIRAVPVNPYELEVWEALKEEYEQLADFYNAVIKADSTKTA